MNSLAFMELEVSLTLSQEPHESSPHLLTLILLGYF